jgi:hypothetical protein
MIGHHLSIMGCRSRPRTPIRNVDFKGLIAWLFASEMLPPITALAGFGYVIVGASACLAVLGDLFCVPTTIALTGLFALLAIPPAVALRPFFPRWWRCCRDRPR